MIVQTKLEIDIPYQEVLAKTSICLKFSCNTLIHALLPTCNLPIYALDASDVSQMHCI